jgi:hypothetical protein
MPPFLFKKRVIFFAVILTALGSVGLMALLRLALEVRSRPPDLSATAAALEHQATQSALNSQATEIALHILATTTALEAAAAAIEATQTAVVAPAATGTPLPAPARPDEINLCNFATLPLCIKLDSSRDDFARNKIIPKKQAS